MNILESKAAGFWVALVLTLSPAVVIFLQDSAGRGWIDAGVVGLVVLAINGLVKWLQIAAPQPVIEPKTLPAADLQTSERAHGVRSVVPAAQIAPMPAPSKMKQWLLG